MGRDVLAIDFGTVATTAVLRGASGTFDVHFGSGRNRMPSSVFRTPGGVLVAGEAADNQALMDPLAYEPTPKRRVGQGSIRLGGVTVSDVDLVTAVLRNVVGEVARLRNGDLDLDVCMTHPALWAGAQLGVLQWAAANVGFPFVRLMPEPVAAATFYAHVARSVDGHRPVCVYDLGGGTFDVAVLVPVPGGFELAGPPSGIDPLGGVDFDQALAGFVLRQIGEQDAQLYDRLVTGQDYDTRRERRNLAESVRQAKELLSTEPSTQVVVRNRSVTVTRQDFERLIAPDVHRTLDALQTTIAAAHLPEPPATVYLVGGSSRIPLVQQQVWERTRIRPTTLDDPKLVVARGATLALTMAPPPQAPPPDQPPRPNQPPPNQPPTPPIPNPEPEPIPNPNATRKRALLVVIGALVAVLLLAGGVYAATRNGDSGGGGGSADHTCADGTVVSDASTCTTTPGEVECPDGSMAASAADCPSTEPPGVTCSDASVVSDVSLCAPDVSDSTAVNPASCVVVTDDAEFPGAPQKQCTAADGAATVSSVYVLEPNGTLEQAFFTYSPTYCSDFTEYGWTADGSITEAGLLGCYTTTADRAAILWTSTSHGQLYIAVGAAGMDTTALYTWWTNHACGTSLC